MAECVRSADGLRLQRLRSMVSGVRCFLGNLMPVKTFLAIGTGEKLYLYSASVGSSFDITPTGFVAGRATAVQGTGYGVGGFNGTAIQKTVTASDIAVGSSTTITSTSTDFTTIFSAPEDIQVSGFQTAQTIRPILIFITSQTSQRIR